MILCDSINHVEIVFQEEKIGIGKKQCPLCQMIKESEQLEEQIRELEEKIEELNEEIENGKS